MKNSFLVLLTLAVFSSCSTGSTQNDSVDTSQVSQNLSADSLSAALYMPDTVHSGQPLLLKFTVYNKTDSLRKFCKWHTPFEPLMSKYLEVKNEKGEEAVYKGPMAKRMMPPPDESYVSVNANDSLSVTVELLRGYSITDPGKYTITYTGQGLSGLSVPKRAWFVYLGQ
ncbi:protease [Hufsiella ginkgonis]|uniref:Protease n=1 Tax=Hufsiella ginkgonis TaxID=2695274 RepID=A0A7K1XVM8_9SPHI|nr:protease [Hufsiella ginkgonis]MXV15055.1 protease [Hufsiella ginkgonis]